MKIDVGEISIWITTVSAICVPLYALVRQAAKLLNRLEVLEDWTKMQQADIERNKTGRRVLIEGTLACLEGLHEQGCNGAVTDAIKNIKQFLFDASQNSNNTTSTKL